MVSKYLASANNLGNSRKALSSLAYLVMPNEERVIRSAVKKSRGLLSTTNKPDKERMSTAHGRNNMQGSFPNFNGLNMSAYASNSNILEDDPNNLSQKQEKSRLRWVDVLSNKANNNKKLKHIRDHWLEKVFIKERATNKRTKENKEARDYTIEELHRHQKAVIERKKTNDKKFMLKLSDIEKKFAEKSMKSQHQRCQSRYQSPYGMKQTNQDVLI